MKIYFVCIIIKKGPFEFSDKCLCFSLELVDEFTKIFQSSFGPFIGFHQGLVACVKNNTFYTCKKPLMMAYEGSERVLDNFGKFTLRFNETCLNEDCSLITHTHTNTHTHTHTHTHTYIYIYIYIYISFICFKI